MGLLLAFGAGQVFAEVIYVDADAAGPVHDGATWCSAFTDLQDGLRAAAESGGFITEVRVANGVYRPDSGSGDRTAHFQLLSGVAIRGGYAGCGARDPDWRDYERFETILSGDLNGDDGGVDCATNTNCCLGHSGGGCDNQPCADLICALPGTQTCCVGSDPLHPPVWSSACADLARLLCCDLGENRCDNSYHVVEGLAVDSTALLEGFTLARGFANDIRPFPAPRTDAQGGGFFLTNGTPRLSQCVVRNNAALFGGGGYAEEYSQLFITDSTFTENFARDGAAFQSKDSGSVWDDCTLFGNDGGYTTLSAMGDGRGYIDFTNCTVSAHTERDGLFIRGPADVEVSGCRFSGYRDGLAAWFHGNDVTLDDCQFTDNGAAVWLDFAQATISHSRFVGNGFGVISDFAAARVRDSVFVHGPNGGAFEVRDGYLEADRIVVAYNDSVSPNAGLYLRSGTGVIRNSVFWGNGLAASGDEEWQIDISDGTLHIDYTIVEGWTGALGGVGNTGDDPLFVDPDGPDDVPGNEDDDFRLRPGSPAINAGDPAYVPEAGDVDLDGHARLLCGWLDLGAYEFGIGDFDCDQSVGPSDLPNWAGCCNGPEKKSVAPGCEAFDFNADTDVDLADFAGFSGAFGD